MEAETVRDSGEGGDLYAAMMELHPPLYDSYRQKELEAPVQEGLQATSGLNGGRDIRARYKS